jgi:hypothetical protein
LSRKKGGKNKLTDRRYYSSRKAFFLCSNGHLGGDTCSGGKGHLDERGNTTAGDGFAVQFECMCGVAEGNVGAFQGL